MGQYHRDPLITQNLFEKLSAEKYPNPPKNAKKVITEPLLLQSHQLFSNLVLLVPEKAPPSSCLSVKVLFRRWRFTSRKAFYVTG